MPLMKLHVIKGRSREAIDMLLETVHAVMVETFKVPDRDRYQILNEHEASNFRALDTGLGIPRTDKFLLLEIVTRPRSQAEKLDFYARLSDALLAKCGMNACDVMVSITQNTDDDWSFGMGRAQFLTGELGGQHHVPT
jgi:phenylpyruvate tautomerase PptA (4-oxalocrotonate tautomerase family)